MSFGVGLCRELECNNDDNGTFIVDPETLQIVGRKYSGRVQKQHSAEEIATKLLNRVKASEAVTE